MPTAATSERGIATKVIPAARMLARNTKVIPAARMLARNTTVTSTTRSVPSLKAAFRFDSATSMKSAWRMTSRSMRTPFQVVDAKGQVVARGRGGEEPIRLPPGQYQVQYRIEGLAKEAEATITAGTTTRAPLQ